MLINEVSKKVNLTKKAIEYYIEKELIFPDILDNGYRDFGEKDLEYLKKISILRKLGLTIEEIRMTIQDETSGVLKKLSVQKELDIQRNKTRKVIIDKLSCGKSYEEINLELISIDQSQTIAEKLLESFPGFYGRFICLHFSRFILEPVTTAEQKFCYEEIIRFLDNVSLLDFPEELKTFVIESTNELSTENICDMIEKTKESIENPDDFLNENEEMIEKYLSYKKSDKFKNSYLYNMQKMIKEFYQTSGYYDIFIPALKKLSSSYSEYSKQMEFANEKLLLKFPEIKDFV